MLAGFAGMGPLVGREAVLVAFPRVPRKSAGGLWKMSAEKAGPKVLEGAGSVAFCQLVRV